jgi:hypothetical protein
MARTFVCLAALERIEAVVRDLVNAGLADTQVAIVYPRLPHDARDVREGEAPSRSAALDLPGLAPLIGDGPILVSLGDEDATASTDLEDVLDLLGVAAADAQRWERHVDNGDVLLSVRCSDDASYERVSDVLAAAGAECFHDREYRDQRN